MRAKEYFFAEMQSVRSFAENKTREDRCGWKEEEKEIPGILVFC